MISVKLSCAPRELAAEILAPKMIRPCFNRSHSLAYATKEDDF
jgi:hypothetical protein